MTLPRFEILRHPVHRSETGAFVELARAHEIPFKQVSLCMIQPGNDRGGHFHTRKEEWFCVIQGEMILRFEDGQGGKEEIQLSDKDPCLVYIPIGVKHSAINPSKNICKFLILANEEFDPQDPDTFSGLPPA